MVEVAFISPPPRGEKGKLARTIHQSLLFSPLLLLLLAFRPLPRPPVGFSHGKILQLATSAVYIASLWGQVLRERRADEHDDYESCLDVKEVVRSWGGEVLQDKGDA